MKSGPITTSYDIDHVHIIGAGPIGLLAAILLKQRGLLNVTVMDEEVNKYYKSGDYRDYVFDLLWEVLNNKAIPPEYNYTKNIEKVPESKLEKLKTGSFPIAMSSGRHIKDTERSLYDHAYHFMVNFSESKFVKFENKNIVARDLETKELMYTPTRLVIDCGGVPQPVVKEVKLHHPKAFTRLSLVKSQHWILARGYMSESDRNKYSTLSISPDTIEKVKKLSELGWNEIKPPFTYENSFHKDKVNIYMEAPDHLRDDLEAQKRWVSAVLELRLGSENSFKYQHESKKHPKKQVISYYRAGARRTTPAYFLGDEKEVPMVFHAGDATADLPSQMGQGLFEAIKRVFELVQSFTIVEGKITHIDLLGYTRKFEDRLYHHEQLATSYYKYIENEKIIFQKLCSDAATNLLKTLSKIDESKEVKLTTKEDMDKAIEDEDTLQFVSDLPTTKDTLYTILSRQFGLAKYYKKLSNHFNEEEKFDNATLYHKKSINLFLSFKEGMETLLSMHASDGVRIPSSAMLELAKCSHEIANHFFDEKKFYSANVYYNKAINIYKSFPDKYKIDEMIALHLNSMLVAYEFTLKNADRAYKKIKFKEILEKGEDIRQNMLPNSDTKEYEITLNYTTVFINLKFAHLLLEEKAKNITDIEKQVALVEIVLPPLRLQRDCRLLDRMLENIKDRMISDRVPAENSIWVFSPLRCKIS